MLSRVYASVCMIYARVRYLQKTELSELKRQLKRVEATIYFIGNLLFSEH